jgi:selenocysteine lyase/cysteine desulfurase
LRQSGINVSVSSPSSTLIDATRRELPDMVRSSVHYYNEDSELEALVNAVAEIARQVPA